jgi:hypothetical protein
MVPRPRCRYCGVRRAKSSLLQFLQTEFCRLIFIDLIGREIRRNGAGCAEGVLTNMSSTKSKLRLLGAFAALLTLALAVGCRGFFVKPTLTAIAVGPLTPTIYVGATDNTVQMFAVGTFNDGSSGSTPVTWGVTGTGTDGQPIATVTTGGLVTAQSSGSGTVTAASNLLPSISGSQPLVVSVACTSAPIVTPSSPVTLTTSDESQTFTATCNGGQDITAVATWFSSNTTWATFDANVLTATAASGADGTFFITATANGFTSNQVQVTTSGF